jgi:hypothetical protein
MEPIESNLLPPASVRFNENVQHRQTRGNVLADGGYDIVIKQMPIPLVDEHCSDDIFTKNDILKLEKEFKNLQELQNQGLPLNLDNPNDMSTAHDFFKHMETLFEGREALPSSLVKSIPRTFDRIDVRNSAGVRTQTYGMARIGKIFDSASWQNEEHLERQLKQLHDRAIMIFCEKMKFVTQKKLKKKMMKLRELDKVTTLSENELCSLYLDYCSSKEQMRSVGFNEKVTQLATAEEKKEAVEKYHVVNWIPINLNTGNVDVEYVKGHLEKMMDFVFDKGTLDARYSSVTKRDIKDFIWRKYKF